MNHVSIGDMAQSHQTRRHQVALKTTLSLLTEEVATGLRKDIGAAVRGDFTALSGIEASLKTLGSYDLAAKEGAQLAAAMQASLGALQSHVSGLGTMLDTCRWLCPLRGSLPLRRDPSGRLYGSCQAQVRRYPPVTVLAHRGGRHRPDRQLHAVEEEARGAPPDRRAELRKAHAAPVFDDPE